MIVLPATMNAPLPRWWIVRGAFLDGSIDALITSRMKNWKYTSHLLP